MIGAVHIPKFHDTVPHLITYSTEDYTKVEGKMQLIPKFSDVTKQYLEQDQVTMLMEMDGNDHTYKHDIRFAELRDRNFTIITPTIPRAYIIKVVVEHKIDMGATYHATLKFIKITDPKMTDIVSLDDIAVQNTMHLYQSEFTKIQNNDYSRFKPKGVKIENEEYKMYIPREVGSGEFIYVENPEYKKAKEQQVTGKLLETGKDYYVVSRKDGRFFIYNTLMRKSLKNITDIFDIRTVKPSLINKINTKLTMAKEIDGQFIRSLISFIHREDESLPIDVMTSIITQCLYKTVDVETQVKIMKDAGVTGMINDLKIDNVQTVPTRFWESLFTGNIFKYIKLNVGQAIWNDSAPNKNSEKIHSFH
jgi:hypothetical protein